MELCQIEGGAGEQSSGDLTVSMEICNQSDHLLQAPGSVFHVHRSSTAFLDLCIGKVTR